MKNLKKIREEHGAGEWGTDELTNKYKSMTPGQEPTVSEESVEDHEASMQFHHNKAQEAKKRGDNAAFERHMDIKHNHAIVRDKMNAAKSKREAEAARSKNESVEPAKGDLGDACWKGYTAVGTKEKDGKTVPNCVPEESVEEAVHDYDVTVHHNHGQGKTTQHVYRVTKAVDHNHAGWIAMGKHKAQHGIGQGVHSSAGDAKKLTKEGWEMPLPVEPESELQYTEDKDGDYEGQMAKWQLQEISEMAAKLAENMDDDDELEAWVQEHVTTAYNALDDVYSYADSNDMDLDGDDDDDDDEEDDDETPEDEDEMDYPESQNEAYHVVGATLSEPNHSMVTKRSETQMRKVKVKADSKEHAVQKAKSFYQKKGYKVHDTFHHSQVNEAAEQPEAEYNPNSPEEKQERMRLETLIRLGLLDRSLLPVIRRSMKKLEYGQNINAPIERAALFDLLQQLVGIVTGDDMIFRKVRLDVTRNR